MDIHALEQQLKAGKGPDTFISLKNIDDYHEVVFVGDPLVAHGYGVAPDFRFKRLHKGEKAPEGSKFASKFCINAWSMTEQRMMVLDGGFHLGRDFIECAKSRDKQKKSMFGVVFTITRKGVSKETAYGFAVEGPASAATKSAIEASALYDLDMIADGKIREAAAKFKGVEVSPSDDDGPRVNMDQAKEIKRQCEAKGPGLLDALKAHMGVQMVQAIPASAYADALNFIADAQVADAGPDDDLPF